MSVNKRLLFGKNDLERIVSIEVNDDTAEIFQELEDGSIKSSFINNRFWILSPYPIGKGWVRLEGDLHYKFGKQYTTRQDFLKARAMYRNNDTFEVFNEKESCMVKDGYTYYRGMKHEEVSILSFDIESTSLTMGPESKVILISNTFRKNGKITKKLFSYDNYTCCGEMIEDWAKWVQELNPSIICGHNIVSYDLPYIHFCAGKTGHSVPLGRDGSNLSFNKYESKFRVDGNRDMLYTKCRIYGREIIDTLFLSYRYDIGRKYESYGLKPIIESECNEYNHILEVGEKLKPHQLQLVNMQKERVFYDAGQIRFTYKDKNEFEKIKQYCINDSDESLFLFDLMSPPYFYMSQSIPKPFQMVIESASGSQINSIMVRAYIQDRHSLPKKSEAENYEGAISFAIPGMYKNLFKIDVSSLYPSIMRQYKVCDKFKDPKGYFIEITEFFATERLKNKKLAKDTGEKYYDDLQSAQKIFANSLYGFLGTGGLNFNSPKNAEFITAKGREILAYTIKWATGKDAEYWIELFKEKTK